MLHRRVGTGHARGEEACELVDVTARESIGRPRVEVRRPPRRGGTGGPVGEEGQAAPVGLELWVENALGGHYLPKVRLALSGWPAGWVEAMPSADWTST